MARKIVWSFFGASTLISLMFGLAQPTMAKTQTGDKDESCMACHENLYLLHDIGKWYCLCGTRARCTYCHAGTTGALDEDSAHQGLIASPVKDNPRACQSCHPQDYAMRVEKFASLGGIRPEAKTMPAYIPVRADPDMSPIQQLVDPQPIQPWHQAGLGVVGVCLAGLAVIFVRGYRQNHQIH